jgi:hypothetical protein
VSVPAFASRAEATGVCVRQAGADGRVSAQAGSATSRRREAQSPPKASWNPE